VLIRSDILEPDGRGGWVAIEVKASSRVRPYQVADLSTQVWVMQGCGLHISRAVIRYLAGRIDWFNLDVGAVRFGDTDVTARVRQKIGTRRATALRARTTLADAIPQIKMGDFCDFPLRCEFRRHCKACAEIPLLAEC